MYKVKLKSAKLNFFDANFVMVAFSAKAWTEISCQDLSGFFVPEKLFLFSRHFDPM